MSAFTAPSRSSKLAATSAESRSTPSVSCVRSFEPIDMPSKYCRNSSASRALPGNSHIMMSLRPASPRRSPLAASSSVTLARLLDRAHERHHDLDVVEAEVLAHALQRPAFQLEAGAERRIDVARGAAEAQHRVFLVRLVLRAADQVGVLVRLEIGQPHDDRLGRESRRDLRHALAQAIDEEADRIAVAGDVRSNALLQRRLLALELQQRPRMDADHAVDDEFEARQADAMVRQRREGEGAVRVADVHHDAHRGRRHLAEFDLLLLEIEQALVDEAGVALGAGHGHVLAVADLLHGVAAAHDRRHAELAGDDRGMAGAAAPIGDDRGGALHDRLPVRIGHVGHQHLARLHQRHAARIAHDAGATAADAPADAAALGQYPGALAQAVALHASARAAVHGLGTRLQDVELAIAPVARPLDVHRAAVVLLDDQCLARQLLDFVRR